MLQTPLDVGKMARPESAPRTKILIVEKHAAVRRALRKRLSATPDLDVLAAVQDPAAALPYLNRSSDCLAAPDAVSYTHLDVYKRQRRRASGRSTTTTR